MTTDPLISTALLGTARMSAMPNPPDPLLEKTWQGLDSENPAIAVLQALALTRALHLTGASTVTLQEEISVSPAEKYRTLSSTGVDLATRLFAGEFPEILPEWMALATQANRILPPRVLPELLALATKHKEYRPAAIALSGERGLWIARRHESYQWLLETAKVDEGAWEHGTPIERLAWLRQTRADDPGAAANMIANNWSEEDAFMRESVLRLVSENPQACDETWLENLALKDRRQEIRELAMAALVNIPNSAYGQRALGRLRDHLKIERRLMKRVINIDPPSTFDTAWVADGIKEKPLRGTGEKAWWLRQIISMIPLDAYPGLLDVSEDDLFSLSREKDWQDDLIAGWIESALRFPKRALARKFIPFIAAHEPWPAGAQGRIQVIQAVMEPLTISEQYEILDKLAKTMPEHFTLDLLTRMRGYPRNGEGKNIFSVMTTALSGRSTFLTRPQARALAICIPPDQIQHWLERLAKLPELSAPAEEFATTLEFRRTMISQFQLP